MTLLGRGSVSVFIVHLLAQVGTKDLMITEREKGVCETRGLTTLDYHKKRDQIIGDSVYSVLH